METLPRRIAENALPGLRIDDRHPAAVAVAGVVADPQIAAVRLQRNPHGLAPCRYILKYPETVGIDHGNFPGIGQRHIQTFVLAADHPVHG
ncbi:hypothetical protein D3C80_1938860 [compost metagenome]